MKKLFAQYSELIAYGFWGGMTTLVNCTVYFFCTRLLKLDPLAGNTAAWVLSVLFAFLVNKQFVFFSHSWQGSTVFREAWQFVSARLFSGMTETLLLYIFAGLLSYNDAAVKIFTGIFVILLNYLLSKIIIFRTEGAES